MGAIADNMQAVRARIAAAETASGRPSGSVSLLAVSKTWPTDSVRAAAAAGQCAFGENYVQEAVGKIAALADLALEWHFIGPLQRNKTRSVAERVHWVHSVDRPVIAERLSAQRPAAMPPLNVCLQVNIDREPSKAGFSPDRPGELIDVAQRVAGLPGLTLRGLMAIPAPRPDTADERAAFAALRRLFATVAAALPAGVPFDTLSMGMSHDLEAAVAEGATLVRIGTAIFGERT